MPKKKLTFLAQKKCFEMERKENELEGEIARRIYKDTTTMKKNRVIRANESIKNSRCSEDDCVQIDGASAIGRIIVGKGWVPIDKSKN